MSKTSGKTDRAVVKFFINAVACASMIPFSTTSMAQSEAAPAQKVVSDEAYAAGQRIASCERKLESIKESRKKAAEFCRKAGLSSSTEGDSFCVQKSLDCGNEVGKESFDSVDAIAAVFGVPADDSKKLADACPIMSGRDYFKEKDAITKEIKETEKELAELNDDKAEIQEKYNETMQDLQEALTKAQEDLKEKNLKMEQEDRDRIAEFHATQNQAKDELRKKGAEILRLRGQVIQSQRDKALKLIAMTDASGKRACMKAVREAKKSYESISGSSSSNHIAQSKQKKQDLINLYNDCMEAFDQQRIALNESKRQEQIELNTQIDSLQSSMDEIQNSLNLANSQLEEMKQASEKRKSDALQSVIDLGTLTQQKMQAAYSKLQENLKTIAAKGTSLQAALNRANASLMTLGPAPKSRNSEYAPSDASADISAEVNNIEEAKAFLNNTPACAGMLPPEKKVPAKKSTKTGGTR